VASYSEERTYNQLKVFDDKVLRKIFGPKNNEVGSLGHYIMMNFVMYADHLVSLGEQKLGGCNGGKRFWLRMATFKTE
jgi:hypothetical protein